jgi:hypothetical protein
MWIAVSVGNRSVYHTYLSVKTEFHKQLTIVKSVAALDCFPELQAQLLKKKTALQRTNLVNDVI